MPSVIWRGSMRLRTSRRKFFNLARMQKAPIAIQVVARIDALFAIEREINGLAPEQRLAARTSAAGRSSSRWSDVAPNFIQPRA